MIISQIIFIITCLAFISTLDFVLPPVPLNHAPTRFDAIKNYYKNNGIRMALYSMFLLMTLNYAKRHPEWTLSLPERIVFVVVLGLFFHYQNSKMLKTPAQK